MLKFYLQLENQKKKPTLDCLNSLNLNKSEIFLNSKPLSLLYFSKTLFTAEQVLRDNDRRFKFIVYQVTEQDYVYSNLIHITRYSRNFFNSEFFLHLSDYRISKIITTKIYKLVNFSTEHTLINKLLKFENLNNLLIRNTLFWEFFLKTSRIFNCQLQKFIKNARTDLFLNEVVMPALHTPTVSAFKNLITTSFSKILIFFSSPIRLKHLINCTNVNENDPVFYLKNPKITLIFKEVIGDFTTKYFINSKNFINNTNLIPNSDFFFLLKKKILKTLDYQKFNTSITP